MSPLPILYMEYNSIAIKVTPMNVPIIPPRRIFNPAFPKRLQTPHRFLMTVNISAMNGKNCALASSSDGTLHPSGVRPHAVQFFYPRNIRTGTRLHNYPTHVFFVNIEPAKFLRV